MAIMYNPAQAEIDMLKKKVELLERQAMFQEAEAEKKRIYEMEKYRKMAMLSPPNLPDPTNVPGYDKAAQLEQFMKHLGIPEPGKYIKREGTKFVNEVSSSDPIEDAVNKAIAMIKAST